MIEIKDIWFKAEDLTQSLTDKSPEYFKILIKFSKTVVMFVICSTIFLGLLTVAGFFGLMIWINSKINPKKPEVYKQEIEPEVEEQSDFSNKEPISEIEKLRKDGLM
tara:strand:- start:2409 stop:2729 length:321 start_codon:yes stop_codon:yes gene_type:complete